jgi:hypothetical protein
MTNLEQLEEWVKGNSVHNSEHGQCCPDFSCCVKEITTSVGEKLVFLDAFKQGDTDATDGMLMMFLSQLLTVKFPDKDVHVAGFQNDKS